jgi:hypothetical protein
MYIALSLVSKYFEKPLLFDGINSVMYIFVVILQEINNWLVSLQPIKIDLSKFVKNAFGGIPFINSVILYIFI